MIILFVYIILMKLTINQIFIIILAISIITYSSFYKGKKNEHFNESGLDHYVRNTTGILCDESLDATNHENNVCDRLAKKRDVKKLWHYFYDKPHSLGN